MRRTRHISMDPFGFSAPMNSRAFGGLSALGQIGGAGAAAGGFPWATAGLVGGGALLGGASSLFGTSPGRAARQAQDYQNSQNMSGMNRLGMAYFGPSNFMDFLGGTEVWGGGHGKRPMALEGALASGVKPADMSEEEWSRIQGLKQQWDKMQSFVQQMGGPLHQQIQGASDRALSDVDGAFSRVLERNKGGMARDIANYQRPIDQFDRDAHGILSAAGEQAGLAGRYGAEREGVIRRDASKMNADLDGRTRGLLTAAGFGGTTEANMLAGNARQTQEAMQTSLADLADRKLGADMAAQGAFTSALQSNANTRAGLGSQFANQIAQLGLQRNILAGEADQNRTSQRYGYSMAPIQSALGILQSGAMNPQMQGQASSYIPQGQSPFGNFASQMGGNLFGLGMMNLLRN